MGPALCLAELCFPLQGLWKNMENSIYVGLSRATVLQTQMDMVANNVANMDTPGYRTQNLLFKEMVEKPSGQKFPYSMVSEIGQFETTTPGTMHTTGNRLDVALQGPGFFGVVTPGGIRYTRAGNLTLDANGQIVTASGLPIASSGGSPITVPAGTSELSIDEAGNISTEDGQIGQLQVSEFSNTDALTLEGSGLYRPDNGASPTPATKTRVMQGMLEGSNVQGVVEMTRMIGILRDYQSLQRLLQNEHDMSRSAIQRITRTNG